MKARRYAVLMRLSTWRKMHLSTDSHSIGFLPVYESLGALLKDFPACDDYVMIEKKPKQKKGR